jgi:hypothetical protein
MYIGGIFFQFSRVFKVGNGMPQANFFKDVWVKNFFGLPGGQG